MQAATDQVFSASDQKSVSGILASWLDRGILLWVFVLVGFAPHSIAVTQSAWGLGLFFWVLRYLLKPRPRLKRTPLDYLLLGFFLLTALSSFVSYAPMTSIGKLRAASLFTIFYLVVESVRTLRFARALVITLVASCMINVLYTAGQRAVGRGVKLENLAATSLFAAVGIREGDTILKVDGHKVWNPDQLANAIANPSPVADPAIAKIEVYHVEAYPIVDIKRADLPAQGTALQRLGASDWSRGRDWRATGFYDHYVTYSEALQLILSVAFGLLIALKQKRSWRGALLVAAVGGMCFALLLTVTRASMLSSLISGAVIVLLGANRRTILLILVLAVPLALTGLFVLQQKRHVSFFDSHDDSIGWRKTVQREGLRLFLSSPRNMIIGVGMDSIKIHWKKWGLFENNIPMGHMHSDYLEIALERGLLTLLAWLALLFVYGLTLFRTLRNKSMELHWIDRGLMLGALGGLIGFLSSGLVHYNWGDSEVVMVFYTIMGLSMVIVREVQLSSPLTAKAVAAGN